MNVFLHCYDGIRHPLTSAETEYVGHLEGYMHQGEVALAILEPPLFDFREDNSEQLSWVFEAISAFNEECQQYLIPLPYNYITGSGKGYVLDLQDHFTAMGYKSLIYRVRHHELGSPIKGLSAFLYATKNKDYSPPKSINLTEMTASRAFPDIITFAPKYVEKVLFVAGSGSLHGFLKATDMALPQLKEWGGLSLMCERKEGNTLRLSRLRVDELNSVFGTSANETNINALQRIIPNVVYDTFLLKYEIQS